METTVLSVGTEVVLGDQVDANAAWLSQRLREVGIEVRYHLAAGDDLDELVAALRWAVSVSEVVIVGGGLGPTPDDLTREAVAELSGVPLESRGELEEAIIGIFAEHGRRMPASNLRQARLPRGATAYPPLGTAPGFQLELDGCLLCVLPGVPWEQQEMFTRDVLPELVSRTGGRASITRTVHVTGMGESAVAEVVERALADADTDGDDRTDAGGVAVSYLATGGEVQVRVTATASDPVTARARTEPALERIRQALGRGVTGVDSETLEQVLLGLLRQAGQTVAFAESATAGGISARMAAVPDASQVLEGGVAVYATASKTRLLGVPEELIERHTPVSEEVTRELALRVRELFASDWGVAVTGVAGPGTQGGKPVGTVFWAVAGPDGRVAVKSARFPGDRSAVLQRLGSAALELLRRELQDARA